MKLSIRGAAGAFALLYALVLFITGMGNLITPTYGEPVLELAASIYPGYQATASFGQVLVGTLYAAVDGAVTGAIFAWIYNRFAGVAREPQAS
jgi:hypothetical protein